jgi:uncharacterized protein with FMN-binding domain
VERNESAAYYALLGLTIAFTLLAVITMLPNPAASKPNVLGYRSVCSFAPAASALCGLLAGLTCTIRGRRVSKAAPSARYKPFILPIAVGLVLLVLAAVFAVRFGVAQSRFGVVIARTELSAGGAAQAGFGPLADGTRSATVSEGEVSATVAVTVRSGAIEKLELTAGRNVDQELAGRMFDRVRAAGSLSVDAVSGATASSNVLLNAIGQALSGNAP